MTGEGGREKGVDDMQQRAVGRSQTWAPAKDSAYTWGARRAARIWKKITITTILVNIEITFNMITHWFLEKKQNIYLT